MKADILLDAIGLISDEYVQDAKAVGKVRKNNPWLKWGAPAACACVLLSVGLLSGIWNGSVKDAFFGGSANNTAGAETGFGSSPECELETSNQSSYPYSDTRGQNDTSVELVDMETADGIIVFNKITDIETYQALNNQGESVGEACYKTHEGLYQCLAAGQAEVEYFQATEENGVLWEDSDSKVFQQSGGEYEMLESLSEYLLSNERVENSIEGAVSYELETMALSTNPAEGGNGQITVLAGRDLNVISVELQNFVSPMRALLGTVQSSTIAGQEAAVQYFCQQCMSDDEAMEECYNYYVYFEKEDMQYLYQFSSNWTLLGEETTAPHKKDYVLSQVESRELFAEILTGIVTCLE